MTFQRSKNPNLTNLWVDGLAFVGTLAAFAPKLTGEFVHEWLGLAFGVALLVHVILHWQWLVGVTRRFFRTASWGARFKVLLNAAIFIAFTVIIFSGVMESRSVLQTFGLSVSNQTFWKMLHSLSADVTLWLTALHIGLHWRWLWSWIKRLLRLPRPARVAEAAQVVTPADGLQTKAAE